MENERIDTSIAIMNPPLLSPSQQQTKHSIMEHGGTDGGDGAGVSLPGTDANMACNGAIPRLAKIAKSIAVRPKKCTPHSQITSQTRCTHETNCCDGAVAQC